MKPANSIKTTGQLRDFLATMMLGVKNGDLSVDKASQIQKIAAQINENFYAEIKVAVVQRLSQQPVAKLGQLPLNDDDNESNLLANPK